MLIIPKSVRETAITVIHEATHAKFNKPNTKSQELQCYVNEYRHQNIELTEKVLQDIINHIMIISESEMGVIVYDEYSEYSAS